MCHLALSVKHSGRVQLHEVTEPQSLYLLDVACGVLSSNGLRLRGTVNIGKRHHEETLIVICRNSLDLDVMTDVNRFEWYNNRIPAFGKSLVMTSYGS